MYSLKFYFSFSFFIFLAFYSFSQTKMEKECKIHEKYVPIKAKKFINQMPFKHKIKWFKEESFNHTSFEAKTTHQGNKYSIEFNPKGIIEDIEVSYKWKNIPKKVQDKIITYLKTEYDSYKFQKIQIQYTGSEENLVKILQQINQLIVIKYEIVVKTRSNNKYTDFEYLFSKEGKIERKSEIIPNHTDNLEY